MKNQNQSNKHDMSMSWKTLLLVLFLLIASEIAGYCLTRQIVWPIIVFIVFWSVPTVASIVNRNKKP